MESPPDRIVGGARGGGTGGARVRVGIGAVVVLVLVGLAVAVLVAMLGQSGTTRVVAPSGPPAPTAGGSAGLDPGSALADPGSAAAGAGAGIFVHLLGAVNRPGLYELRAGDRAIDAVAAAGGFTAEADQAQLNLARLLTDGEQIYVPVIGEVPAAPPGAGGGAGAAGTAGGVPGKVNLNTADEAALDTLPGVGPATARAILEWREANGRFTAVEDLLAVSGIGDKTFADLKDLVTV
ncbi:helix-hairpin-helix domain-containing protein [Marisediminicola senii]|uniref:helix-hairpin-helix domain-containing protein n=1 Tax=Marisediminicola senii TaxID=2711233 RepID=UPI0013EAED6A|nr:helix-hairpin-helix domain-containing protein [Marisediminicola senii]